MKRSSHGNRLMLKGFTLVEVVVSIGIFMVIIVAVGAFEINIFSYQRRAAGSFTTLQDSQIILKTVAHDIRMASQGEDGSYALQITATNTLMFFADTNGDGIKERVRYTLSGAKLYKALLVPTGSPLAYSGAESTSTVLTDVTSGSSSVFTYYNGTYAGTTTGSLAQPVTPSTVRLVQISLTLDSDPKAFPNGRTYTTDVTLRNLKDNI